MSHSAENDAGPVKHALCYCTLVYPDGRVEGFPESVNPICPMHGDHTRPIPPEGSKP